MCIDMDAPRRRKSTKEDERLANWKKWLAIRHQFHIKMFNLHHRQAHQLMINAADFHRRKVEDNMVFHYAKIPQVGKRKEDVCFWTFPLTSKKYPSLEAFMKQEQLYEIPMIPYTDVPCLIKKEKGFVLTESTQTEAWRVGEYREKRIKEMHRELRNVQPFKPELDDLIIIGKSFGQQIIEASEVSSTGNELILDHGTPFSNKPVAIQLPITSLTIENNEFMFENKSQIEKQHCIAIDYDFDAQEVVQSKIKLKNTGEVAIRYYWKRLLPERTLLSIIPQRLTTFSFVFEKNIAILLPNKEHTLDIFFKADRLGIHHEDWELITEPDVFQEGSFILKLWAVAEIKNFKSLSDAIQERIEEGIKQTIIERTLLSAIDEAQVMADARAHVPEADIEITEKDVFEVMNADFKRLVYYYNKKAVNEMKTFYKEIRSSSDPKKWNLKLRDIKRIIFRVENLNRQHELLSNFNCIMEQFVKTDHRENTDAKKYRSVYQLFCIMIDQMTEHVMNFREKYKIPIIETYPAVTEENIPFFENYDDVRKGAKFFPFPLDPETKKDLEPEKPPPTLEELEKAKRLEILKTIPFDQIDKRLKIYRKEKYGIIPSDESIPPVEVPKKGKKGKDKKGKKEKKEKGPKEKKDKKEKGGKGKVLPTPRDPIAPPPLSPMEALLTEKLVIKPAYMDDENYVEPTRGAFCTYFHNIYVGIYTILSETISEMTLILDFIDTKKRVSRGLLKKCIEYGIPVMQSEHEFCYGEEEGEGDYEPKNQYLLNHQYDELKQTFSNLDIPEPCESLSTLTKSISSNSRMKYFFGLSEKETQTDQQGIYIPSEHIFTTQTEGKYFDAEDNYSLIEHIEQPYDATSIQTLKRPKSASNVKVIAKMKNFEYNDTEDEFNAGAKLELENLDEE